MDTWHAARVEQFGYLAALGRTVADDGLLAAGARFPAELTQGIEGWLDDARGDAIAACPDAAVFYDRWRRLDEKPAATPEATPDR